MGEAKRRKLAGTYPAQDGGRWTYLGAEVFRAMPADVRRLTDAMVGEWLDQCLPIEKEPELSKDEKRRAIYHLVERGFALLGIRERADGVDIRVVPVMPNELPGLAMGEGS